MDRQTDGTALVFLLDESERLMRLGCSESAIIPPRMLSGNVGVVLLHLLRWKLINVLVLVK